MDGELADDGLAGSGRRGDQHALAVLQCLAGLDLELVEDEVAVGGQFGGEAGQHRVGRAPAGGGVPLRRSGHGRQVTRESRQHLVLIMRKRTL